MNIRKSKIAKFAAGIAAVVLGCWLYRISEYESRDRVHGQCEIEARRLYLKEQEEDDEDKATLSDALESNFATYMDACMEAGGYYGIDRCNAHDPHSAFELALHAYSPDCYAPDDLLRRLMESS